MKNKIKITLAFFIAIFCSVKGYSSSLTTITYQSTTQNTSCKMNIYLPTGYDLEADTVNYYPVFYLIHGGGENYTHWANSGNAKAILDDYISTGKAVPMIVVMPDGKNLAPEVFSKELINDIIPYIENNYRIKADKDHRGVGGLSWGGLQAMDAGIYNYKLFGYLSVLSSGWFTSDNAAYLKAKNFLSANGKDMESSIRYLYFSEGTSTDIAYANGLATLKVLRDSGLTVHYWEHAGGHTWQAWKEDFKSFLPYLFRDSTTKYVSLEFMGGRITTATIMTHYDSLINAPAVPVKTGHTFAGWFKDAAYANSFDFTTDTIKKNITIYAKWNVNSYKVSFNSNSETMYNDTFVKYNTLIKATAIPVKTGYFFDGWYTDVTFKKKWNFFSDKVVKDMILTAKWVDSSSVSVDHADRSKLYIYPNPASSVLHVKNLTPNTIIELYNMEGKLMVQKNAGSSICNINIEAFPQGVYKLKIKNTFSETQHSIVISR